MLTFVRAALVAVCVVALAGCANLTGGGDPNVAATVNGTEIMVSEVEERFEQAKSQPQVAEQLEQDTEGAVEQNIQAQILTQLVVSELLEQWATDLGIDASPEEIESEKAALIEQIGGQEAFDQAVSESGLSTADVELQIRQRVLQNKISAEVGEASDVTAADIKAFYEQNREQRFGDKATARHILVKKEATANQILRELRNGGDFAKIAEEKSTDPGSAAEGGELPEFGRGQMVPPFDEAVFTGEVGELIGPIKTDFGYHIIEVLDRKPGQTLAEATEEIRTELAQTKGGEEVQAQLKQRTEEAEVTVNPRFGDWDAETGQVKPEQPLGGVSESASDATSSEVPPGGTPAPAPSEAGTE